MALVMTGEHVLKLPPEKVWEALNDAEVLKKCIPGCEDLVEEGDDQFVVTVKLSVGPVKARFNGRVRLLDPVPPRSCSLHGEGEGGVAGFAKGSAAVELSPIEEGTRLTYRAEARIGGKIAQLGQRLISGTAKKVADAFFANFVSLVAEHDEHGVG